MPCMFVSFNASAKARKNAVVDVEIEKFFFHPSLLIEHYFKRKSESNSNSIFNI